MIEIRRNLSIIASFTCKNPDRLRELFPEQSEEEKAMAAAFEHQRKLTEEQIWIEIEALETPPRDHFGRVVCRETHEICWERIEEEDEVEGPNGSTIVKMRPYIQPIKSEYEK